MVSPATIPERNNRCVSLTSFMLKNVVTVIWLLILVLASYLKRSREAESVKRPQQGGKRGKFWKSPGERGKIAGLLPGWLSFLDLRPSVFERHRAVKYQCAGGRVRVGTEVSQALELVPSAWHCLPQTGLNQTARDSLQ